MPAFLLALAGLTDRLLKVSGQASLLIGLVLLVQGLAGRKLSPRVRYALWLLVVARLLLPVSLESGCSLFNFTRAMAAKVFQAAGAASNVSAAKAEANRAPAPAASVASASAPTGPAAEAGATVATSASIPVATKTASPPAASAYRVANSVSGRSFPWVPVLTVAWFAGIVFLLARILWIPFRLNARLAQHEVATPPAVFEILDEAKRLSGVHQVLPIVQSRAVESPALLGFIRPWLLLPEGLVEKFTPQELRLVFLHELAHLRRRDIAVNWLTTLLQILHWPNPLVWLAFARMRADRELACDELALSFARAGESQTYGHAIIKLLEGFARPAALPGLVGILEDQTQMKRRITMIAQFKKMTGWSTAAAALVLGIGIVTLTDAQTDKSPKATRVFNGDGPVVKILLSGTASDAGGSLSPDESMVAYDEWSGNSGDVMVRDLRTGKSRNLTAASRGQKGGYMDSTGCWAPDSRAIAYLWYTEGAGDSVRTVSLDGGIPKVVRESKEDTFSPHDWSRDGKFLVGKSNRRGRPISAVAILEVATGELRELEPQIGGSEHLRFSPDGRFIAGTSTSKIFVVSTQGGEAVRLTDSTAEDRSPVFSADGRQVLFSSNRRGSWDLWAVGFENGRATGAPAVVKYDVGDYEKWTTAAGKLAFTIRATQTGVFTVDANGPSTAAREPQEISKSFLGSHVSPAWSPDGRKVAYVRLGRPPLLCVQSLEGGNEEAFKTGLWDVQFIFWSPDNQTLALRGAGKNNTRGVFLLSLETREPVSEPLGKQGRHFGTPQNKAYPLGFSADGGEFGFIVWDGKERERVAFNFKTGVERIVSTAADRAWIKASQDASSPGLNYGATGDGSIMAGIEEVGTEKRIVVADAANQSRRIVARVAAPAELGAPRWSPDGTKLAYYVWPDDSTPRKFLHICAADGSWDRVVNTGQLYIKGGAMAPTWSPDSAKLAVTLASDIPSQIGVLENFLPTEKLAAK